MLPQKQLNAKKYIILLGLCVLAFLPFLRLIITGSSNMGHCIFCEISAGKQPNTVIDFENEDFVIFKDIKPSSTYHYLAVPKRHIESLKSLTKNDIGLVDSMEQGLKSFFEKNNISTTDALFGFHLPPFITVKHLHMHGIAPRSTMSFIHRMMFKTGSAWFKTVEEARQYLQEKS
ncbi:PREDICTED: histidine triad nucleotide-binding protein 3 [Bactrocera latifrons]|uniref:Adenosine 5'-monophosphoramidase HINT3 n=1 Tax=Bactrocera latifrons TaxID=174628 RepID=A0A0K8U0H1_BACLA|nr:PREDICTED: histidine triad nucleotide-binding protein 3 [Bactrocera latifrons]XP_018789660.1 PREDICTED: histidine triad nucleotide-binding protein 3 [Bactrocera latifrons]XP_018789661.1 PREDICTED: histidine triad nucleotide-binding protein 3 [Bactrocera latifrons]